MKKRRAATKKAATEKAKGKVRERKIHKAMVKRRALTPVKKDNRVKATLNGISTKKSTTSSLDLNWV